MKKPKNIDEFLSDQKQWLEELVFLREIILSTRLEETIKWNFPVYTWKNKNIVGLGAFKSYFGVWFFQGASLKDELGVLINAQEGKTQAMRQWRFQSIKEIDRNNLRAYIAEAIDNQKKGKIIKFSTQPKPLIIPSELQLVLAGNSTLKNHFEALSLSKKRDFATYISSAKRTETKEKRLQKIIPMILRNIGLNDKYKK